MPPAWLALIVAFGPPTSGEDDVVTPPFYEIGPSYYCEMDRDCAGFDNRPYCDPESMECSECWQDAHCEDGWVCAFADCVDACISDADCDGVDGMETCNPTTEHCVDCLSDAHCDPGDHCNNTTCVDCLGDEHCAAGQYCDYGTCTEQICEPDQLLCYVGDLAECDSRGGSLSIVEDCDEECVTTSDGPMCPGQATTGDEAGGTADAASSSDGGDDTKPLGDDSGGGGTSGSSAAQGEDGALTRDGCACRARRAGRGQPWWCSLALLIFVRRRRDAR